MTVLPLVLLSIAFLSAATAAVLLLHRYRGPRVIVCPDTRGSEVVEVDAPHAAWMSLVGEGELRLASCSRWPERSGCGQECLLEIAAAPDGCLVRERLSRWYAGKSCAICGRAFEEIRWSDHTPALITAEREIVGWAQIPPRHVMEALATHLPVCWDCDVAETFRRNFADLVLDDPRPIAQSPRRASA